MRVLRGIQRPRGNDIEIDVDSLGGVEVIGPFNFTYQTPHLDEAAKLATLNEGIVVLRAWMEIVEVFTGANSSMILGVGGSSWNQDDYGNYVGICTYAAPLASQPFSDVSTEASFDTGSSDYIARVIDGPGALIVSYSDSIAGVSDGEANVFAIIKSLS